MKRSSIGGAADAGADAAPASSTSRKVKLLLHTVDGVVPYLTPSLLRNAFPPERYPHLWLGIAVRDTCVVSLSPSKDQKSSSRHIGYTFSTTTQVDSWIRDYPRLTVPTFDLRDKPNNVGSTTSQQPKGSSKKSSGRNINNNNTSQVVVTNQHVMLWTPNGHIKLTPDLFVGAAQGLASQAVVPLFDIIFPHEMNDRCRNNPLIKRKQSALRRCEEWYTHCRTGLLQHGGRGDGKPEASLPEAEAATTTTNTTRTIKSVYAPVLIDPQQCDDWANELESQLDSSYARTANGIVVIGWHYLQESLQRRHVLSTITTTTNNNMMTSGGGGERELCVLVTESLAQFVDAVCRSGSCTLVGSNLPQTWARTHKAFVLNLSSWRVRRREAHSKRPRLDNDEDNNVKLITSTLDHLDHNGCIDLTPTKDPSSHHWFRDASTIVAGCQCLACTTHSRAYLYHLVCARELLAEMMLFAHNLHHLLALVDEFNQATDDDALSDLEQYLLGQIPKK